MIYYLKNDIPSNIIGLSGIIADLHAKEEFRKLQYGDAFESLRQKAIIESVKESNALEGIITTEERIRDIVRGAAPITHDEKEISGYKDALSMIHREHENMELTEEIILSFQRMIQRETDPKEAGRYKTHDNLIIENLQDGSRRVRFRPVSSKDTPKAMEQLVLAYYDALEQASMGWHENQNDYVPVIVNFMQLLYRCFKDLDDSFMEISLKKAKKSERVEAVLLNAIVPVSKGDILEKLPDVSVKTVELVLSKMLKEDKIKKIGTYRDARYMRKEKHK